MTDLNNSISLNSPEDQPESPSTGSGLQASTPTVGASSQTNGPVLNARSCVTCRRRKVKCNKQYPCSNCLKVFVLTPKFIWCWLTSSLAHIDCIFPAPGRAPRRPRKPPDGELLLRLRRLEGVIQSLGVQVDDEPHLSGSNPGDYLSTDGAADDAAPSRLERRLSFPNEQGYDSGRDAINSLGTELGRLVINEGRSRYVNSRFWAALSTEVWKTSSI